MRRTLSVVVPSVVDPRRLVRMVPAIVLFAAAVVFSGTPARAETDKKDTVKKTWNVAAGHGTYNDAIAIDLPPFRSITPELALRYDSSAGNGELGVGWSLDGVSIIERASPGKGAPRYDDADIFLLDGQELIPCAPASVSPSCTTGGTHSTRIENYERIAQSGSGADSQWTITRKDGIRRVYAPIATVNGGADVSRWGLHEVIDTRDNVVTYTWGADRFGCCWEHLDAISYGGAAVTIHYEARDDAEVSAMGSGSMRTARGRIKTIDIGVDGRRVRAYSMAYAMSDVTTRSLLSSVQQFGADATLDASGTVTGGTRLPAATMDYQAGRSDGFVAQAPDEFSFDQDANFMAFDIDGDGRDDLLEIHKVLNVRHMRTWLSNGEGFVEQSNVQALSNQSSAQFHPMDVNGDGKTDLLEVYPDILGTWRLRTWISNGTGFVEVSDASTGALRYDATQFLPMDIDGDGMSDLLELRASLIRLDFERVTWLSTGDGFVQASSAFGIIRHPDSRFLVMDVDGDGMSDFVELSRTLLGASRRIWRSHGTGFSEGATDRFNYDPEQEYLPMDVNGDGKTDLLHIHPFGTRNNLSVWLSTGDAFTLGFEQRGALFSQFNWYIAMDVNGDGRSDLVEMEPGSLGFYRRQIWLSVGTGFVPGAEDLDCGYTESTQFLAADVDGDGLSEMVELYPTLGGFGQGRRVWLMSTGVYPDLLSTFRSGLGGATSIRYTPSSAWDNVNNPPLTQTATTVTSDDGRGGTTTATYAYGGGLHDRAERRFLGFRHETQTKPCVAGESSCPYVEILYRQDLAAASKPEQIDEHAGDGELLRRRLLEYTTNGEDVPRTALPTGTWAFTLAAPDAACPGAACKRTYTSRTFNEYGDVTSETDHGDFDAADDDDTTVTTFVPNTEAYIVNRPARRATYVGLDASGERLLETQWSYDGADGDDAWQQAPSAGLETGRARWSSSTDRFVETQTEFDRWGNVTAQVDEVGARADFEFDPTHHLFQISTTNALGQATHTTWDTGCAAPASTTGLNGERTTMTYDPLCRMTERRAPGGRIERHAWVDLGDASRQHEAVSVLGGEGGEPLWQRRHFDGLGRTWREVRRGPDARTGDIYVDKTYDARGNESSTTRPYYWAAGDPVPATYATATSFDALDRPTRVSFPDGAYTTKTYGAWSVTETDELGHAKTDRFDAHQRRIAHDETVAGAVRTTTYVYDHRGALARSTDPQGNVVAASTDSLGRRQSVVDPDWGTWTYEYDDAGRMTAKTDAKGQRTEFIYDALGRKLSKTSLASTEAAVTVTWTYDEVRDGHDNIGKLTSISDPAGGETFDHDVAGNVVKTVRTTDGQRYAFEHGFDALGRKLWTLYPDGYTIGTPDAPLEYDAAGRISAIPGYVTSAQYTAEGQLARLEAANGAITTRRYFAERGWLIGISTLSAGETIQDLAYTRDINGSILEIVSADEQEGWLYDYDELNRLVRASNAAHPELDEAFEYDAIGNITWSARVGQYAYGTRPHAAIAAGSNTYTYDAAGLMTSGPGRVMTWDGDNRLASVSPDDPSGDHEGGASPDGGGVGPGGSAALRLALWLGLLWVAFAWSRERRAASTTVQPWTIRPRWVSLVPMALAVAVACGDSGPGANVGVRGASDAGPGPNGGGPGPNGGGQGPDGGVPGAPTDGHVRMAFGYDANDVRIRAVEGDVTRHYVGDDFEAAGGASIKYVTLAGSPVARVEGDTRMWVHTNHLGSIQAETDASGREVHRKIFRPYGEIASSDGPLAYEPRGFTGQRHDPSGLVYLHARYYDPALGRFISPDEIIDGTDTVGLNRYAYCGNDPVNHTDVDGRDKDDTEADQGGGGGDGKSLLESAGDAATETWKKYRDCKHVVCKVADRAEKFLADGASAVKDGYDAAGRAYDKASYGAGDRDAAQAFILHTAGSWIDGKTFGLASQALNELRKPPDWAAGPSTPDRPASPTERAQAQAQAAAEQEKRFSDNARKPSLHDMIDAQREAAIERDRQERRAQEQRVVDLYIHGPH